LSLHGVTLGRRLFGSIRALLPAKFGLSLLLHLRSNHPLLHPSLSAFEEDPLDLEEDAAAAAGVHMLANGRYSLIYFSYIFQKLPAHNVITLHIRASLASDEAMHVSNVN
jgi:hypothetical protein